MPGAVRGGEREGRWLAAAPARQGRCYDAALRITPCAAGAPIRRGSGMTILHGGHVANARAALTGDGFRSDINGLRAWAVIAVVLYHFAVPGFGGGFAGVDLFFVISGFLMAGIVVGGLESGRFGLVGFYLARARRILPALVVLVGILLLAGWFLLMPWEYQSLGRHARDSLLFSSNLRYLAEAGYFDSASHEKWLLHTWSLSVEWQFYLLYPLLLLLLGKWLAGRRALLLAHLAALLASFALCQWLSATAPSQAFFLLQSRAWELLVGGMVFFLAAGVRLPPRGALALESLGIALIAAAIVLVDASQRWPGTAALLPTLGAAAILLARREGSWATGGAIAQWLGTRSYSIYLWHWPLVVGLSYLELSGVPLWIAAGLTASLLLGHLSYAGVEVPARRWLAQRSNLRAAVWLVAGIAVVAVAAQTIRRSGFPDRLPEAVARIEAERNNRNLRGEKCFGADADCIYGGPQVGALVVGDSHANALVTAVAAALPDARRGVRFKGVPACLIVFAARSVADEQRARCDALKTHLDSRLPELFPGQPLILINRTSYYALGDLPLAEVKQAGRPQVYFSAPVDTPTPEYLAEFRRHYVDSVCRMARNHPVYLVRPIPEMPKSVPQALGRAMLLGKQGHVQLSREEYRRRHAFVWAAQDEAVARCGARVLDPLPYLCDEQYCHGSRDGWPLYSDDDHLSEFGNRLLMPMFAPIFASPAPASVR